MRAQQNQSIDYKKVLYLFGYYQSIDYKTVLYIFAQTFFNEIYTKRDFRLYDLLLETKLSTYWMTG